MDKDRAFVEIENILYSKEHENKTPMEHRNMIKDILDELHTYTYNWGKKNGMYKSASLLLDFAEKENK